MRLQIFAVTFAQEVHVCKVCIIYVITKVYIYIYTYAMSIYIYISETYMNVQVIVEFDKLSDIKMSVHFLRSFCSKNNSHTKNKHCGTYVQLILTIFLNIF